GPVAWKTLPSWAIVATEDAGAGTDIVRSMARRAGARVTELKGSHAIMISQPQAVTDVILSAVAALAPAVGTQRELVACRATSSSTEERRVATSVQLEVMLRRQVGALGAAQLVGQRFDGGQQAYSVTAVTIERAQEERDIACSRGGQRHHPLLEIGSAVAR